MYTSYAFSSEPRAATSGRYREDDSVATYVFLFLEHPSRSPYSFSCLSLPNGPSVCVFLAMYLSSTPSFTLSLSVPLPLPLFHASNFTGTPSFSLSFLLLSLSLSLPFILLTLREHPLSRFHFFSLPFLFFVLSQELDVRPPGLSRQHVRTLQVTGDEESGGQGRGCRTG